MSATPKPRVAVLTRRFSRTAGGAEAYVVHLVGELRGEFEFHIFAQSFGNADCAALDGVHWHPVTHRPWWPRWVNQWVFSRATLRATTGFDVVHSHENTVAGNVHTIHVQSVRSSLFGPRAQRSAWVNALKVAFSPRLRLYLKLEAARVQPQNRVIFASAALQTDAISAYPVLQHAHTPSVVLTPGVAASPRVASARAAWLARLALPQAAQLVLFAANDYRRKGLDAALGALAALPANAHLLIAGTPVQKTSYQALAQQLGIAERCHFLGTVPEMPALYHAADCLLHPTLQDAFPMVVLEAMGHELPVVTTSAPFNGMAALLTQGQQALLVDDPSDAQALAACVAQVLGDAKLAANLRTQALAFAQARSWATIAAGQAEIYRAVLARAANTQK